MIFEGQPIYENENPTIVTNPSIIIEVLSNSTESYDKGKKFKYYRSIPSLKEYILIEQDKPYIEHFIKQSENEWTFCKLDKTSFFPFTNKSFNILL